MTVAGFTAPASVSVGRAPSVRVALAVLLVLSLGLSACTGGGGSGAPRAPGQYEVQRNSVHYDGSQYGLVWSDTDGSLHQMQTRNLRMVRDEQRTYLEVAGGGGDPVLHLRQDEPITVDGRDRQGGFSSPWFPFLLGAALGNSLGNRGGGNGVVIINQPAPGEPRSYGPTTPTYRYPPTGSFGRGEELHGTLDTGRPQPPDYTRVAPAPYATSGQSAGTGGGTAATNKSGGGASGASGSANGGATSGASGGTGGGTAASNKGGFSNGSGSGAGGAGVGAGSTGALQGGGSTGTLGGKPSGGLPSGGSGNGSGNGSGKGIGGARSGGGARR